MNIKLDENLPERLVPELRALGHDVDTVRTERLVGLDDGGVCVASRSGRCFADYLSHERERPIAFVWRLRRAMPADFFRETKVPQVRSPTEAPILAGGARRARWLSIACR